MHAPPTTASNAPARRLALMEVPQPVADRRVSFVMIGDTYADLAGGHGTKVRITLVPGPTGQRVVHVKGLTCFVAILGGRPSPAVIGSTFIHLARTVNGRLRGCFDAFPPFAKFAAFVP